MKRTRWIADGVSGPGLTWWLVLVTKLCGPRFPGVHELRHGRDLHLAHDIAAVEFDGDFADTQVEGDLLVDPTFYYLVQDLALAWAQAGKPLDMQLDELMRGRLRDILFNSGGYGV